jgi:hypothetical protein
MHNSHKAQQVQPEEDRSKQNSVRYGFLRCHSQLVCESTVVWADVKCKRRNSFVSTLTEHFTQNPPGSYCRRHRSLRTAVALYRRWIARGHEVTFVRDTRTAKPRPVMPPFSKPSPTNIPWQNKHYSHSIVPGGFDVMSYTTRLMPRTSLTILLEIVRRTSYGSGAQSAVMPSSLSTARTAQVFA